MLLGAHMIVLSNVALPEGVATAAQTILREKDYEKWCLYAGTDAKTLFRRNNSKLLRHMEVIDKL